MSLLFDHLVVKVNNLPAATKSFSESGFTVTPGGVHRGGLSENALVFFSDGSFIELLAMRKGLRSILLKGYAKTRAFMSLKYSNKWGLFHRFYDRALSLPEGITDFCLLADNLSADLKRINDAGLFVTRPMSASRKKPDGSKVRWQMASTLLAELPFLRSAYLPAVPPPPESYQHKNGITGIRSVTLLALDFKEMLKNLATLLDQEPLQQAISQDSEAQFSLGTTSVILKKSSENDALIKKLRGRGLGVFAIEWQFEAGGMAKDADFSNLHGLIVL